MRNLLEYPITSKEVIDYLKISVLIEDTVIEMSDEMGCVGGIDPQLARIALNVVTAASTIVQNDVGSQAAELLSKAFRSQDIPAKEMA